MKDKDTVQISKEDANGELTYFKTLKETTAVGSGCHVVLPVKLLGKKVKVVYGGKE